MNYIVTFTPTPGSFGTLIEYKADGDSVWITPVTSSNPTTLTSYVLESLDDSTTYNVRLSAEGLGCTRMYYMFNIVPDTPSSYNLVVTNTLGGTAITSTTNSFYSVISGSFPISPGGYIFATQTGYSSAISVTITGTPVMSGNLSIYEDDVLIDCIPITTAGVYIFDAFSFTSLNNIRISLSNGGC